MIEEKLHFLQDSSPVDEDVSTWPKVKVPYDIEIQAKMFYYDWEDKTLNPLRDMVITKYVDSTYNRALSMVTLDAPLVGKM